MRAVEKFHYQVGRGFKLTQAVNPSKFKHNYVKLRNFFTKKNQSLTFNLRPDLLTGLGLERKTENRIVVKSFVPALNRKISQKYFQLTTVRLSEKARFLLAHGTDTYIFV